MTLVATVLPASASAARSVPQGFYGANYAGAVETISSGTQSKIWDRLAQGGAESVRVLFNWDLAEKQSSLIQDWHYIDALVTNAAKRNMDVLPVVTYSPPWARKFPGYPHSPPKNQNDYVNFLRKCILRYGPNGSFWTTNSRLPKKYVRRWEVWNEPEIGFHWKRMPTGRKWGPADAREYVSLLRKAYAAVHTADTGAKVVMAALSIDSWKNLGRFYDWAPDIRGAFDIAALQGYSGTASFIPTIVQRFRNVLNSHGASNVPILMTEVTWPAAKGKANPHYTTGYMKGFLTDESGQATRLTKAYKLLRDGRRKWKLQRVYWFTSASAWSGNNEFDYSGLITLTSRGVTGKKSFFAYQKSARAAEGCAKGSNGLCR